MSDDVSFGHLVRRLRRSADLTQRDLAQKIGYSVVTIRKVESDERRPSRDLAERLAACFKVSQEERQTFLAIARALPIAPTNLATPLTRLIGRASETAAIRALLTDRDTRLVTLVGPPGIGKTRLSVQVAGDLMVSFPHGVFSVALGPISDPALVTPTIAKTLGVKESAAQSLIDGLIDYLKDRRLLLVIDNVEHMLAAASDIASVLVACPTLKILATSRQPLHIRGERLYAVPALAVPALAVPALASPGRDIDITITAETAKRYPAVELFIERAQAADRDFHITDANATDVAAICAKLEGIPLAIELVAARIKLLAPQALLARLGSRLDSRLTLLTGGPRDLPERQQTLRGTIDWSYQLLDEGEQALFARLAVFIGGCLPEAVETVANADNDLPMPVLDGVQALTDKNLLRQEQRVDGERYAVFFETIREFALERLVERGEATSIRDRYTTYYLHLAEAACQHLTGREQEAWLDRIEAEHNNIRAVIEHHVQHGNLGPALRMVAAMWRFWHVRAHQTEGGRWIALALAMDGPDESQDAPNRTPHESQDAPNRTPHESHHTRARAQALNGAGWIAQDQSDPPQALAAFTESLRLCRMIGDSRGIAEALHGVGGQIQATGNDTEAIALFSESLSLYRKLDDQEGIAWSLDHLGYAALYLDQPDEAMSLFRESSRIFRNLEHTWGTAISLHHQGLTLMARGEHPLALERLTEGLARFEELGNSWGVGQSQCHLGHLALRVSDHQTAEELFRKSLALSQIEEDRTAMIRSLAGLGSVAVALGTFARAATLFSAVEAFAERHVLRLTPLESAVHRRDVDGLKARLSDPAVAHAWSSARAMTIGQVAAFAMA